MAARKRGGTKSGRKARPKARKPAAKARPAKAKMGAKAKLAPKAKPALKAKVAPKAKPAPKAKLAPKPKVAAKPIRAKRPAPARPRAVQAAPVDRAGMHGEYDALKARAAVITNMLRGATDSQARALELGPWAHLLADLDTWAAKYDVPVKERTVAHDRAPLPSDPTPRWRTDGKCPAEIHERHPGGGYVDCFFRRQTLIGDDCIYKCYTIGFAT